MSRRKEESVGLEKGTGQKGWGLGNPKMGVCVEG
jgi:hypothetical protein